MRIKNLQKPWLWQTTIDIFAIVPIQIRNESTEFKQILLTMQLIPCYYVQHDLLPLDFPLVSRLVHLYIVEANGLQVFDVLVYKS